MFDSVHLQDYPNIESLTVNNNIVTNMDKVRDICNCVFSLRKEENIRVRMPLKKIIICGEVDLEEEYLNIIKQEINTKEIIFEKNIEKVANTEIIINMKECGKIFGSKLKDILFAQKQNNWKIDKDTLHIGDTNLTKDLYKIVYKPKNGEKAIYCENCNLLIMIDTTQTQELIIEGLARDLVRTIQQTRKDIGLEISDKIDATINTNDSVFNEIIKSWKNYICEQTLSVNINISDKIDIQNQIEIDNHVFSLIVEKTLN